MNISELFDTYGVYIIIAAVIIVIIFIAVKIKSVHHWSFWFKMAIVG